MKKISIIVASVLIAAPAFACRDQPTPHATQARLAKMRVDRDRALRDSRPLDVQFKEMRKQIGADKKSK